MKISMHIPFFYLVFYSAFLLGSYSSAEGLDLTLDSFGRTRAPGLTVNPIVGYNYNLWGEANEPWSGYLRPNISVSASPVSVAGKAELEFFPVAFLGFTVGKTWSDRFAEIDGFKCGRGDCDKAVNPVDFSVRALYKYQSLFGFVRFTKTFYDDFSNKTRPVVELNTAILISPNKDIAEQWDWAMLYGINSEWSAGTLFQYVSLQRGSGTENFEYVIARYTHKNVIYTAGVGRFESELLPVGGSLIGAVTWNIIPIGQLGR